MRKPRLQHYEPEWLGGEVGNESSEVALIADVILELSGLGTRASLLDHEVRMPVSELDNNHLKSKRHGEHKEFTKGTVASRSSIHYPQRQCDNLTHNHSLYSLCRHLFY